MSGTIATDWVHSALAVTDVDEAAAFCAAVVGLDVVLREKGPEPVADMVGVPGMSSQVAELTLPHSDHRLELVSFAGVSDELARERPVRPGFGHLAFRVRDLASALETVERLGGQRLGEVTHFPHVTAAYVAHPSGVFLELVQPRDA